MNRKLIFLLIFCVSCTFKNPTKFSELALKSTFYTVENSKTDFKSILEKYKGKKVLIDVWASWCGDCVAGFPALEKLQNEYKEVVYLFLSIDTNIASWKRGTANYNLTGEHYFMEAGMSSDFGDFLNSNSIPRFLVVDENGFIDVYNASKVTDSHIVKALKK